MRLLTVAVVAAAVAVAAPARAGPPARGPWALATVPSVGSIRWSCIAGGPRLEPRHRLSVAVGSATTTATLRIGRGGPIRRTIDPGPPVGFAWTRAETMTLTLVQATEPRAIRATISVDFRPAQRLSGGCEPYLPPQVDVRVAYG